MAQLIQIGNSQGIRIPRPLIEQAQLAGKALRLEVVEGGLLIRPMTQTRAGWSEQIQTMIEQQGPEAVDEDWLDAPLVEQGDDVRE